MAIRQHVIEGFEARNGLILAERGEQIGEFVLRDVESLDGVRQRHEYGMLRRTLVTGVEFVLPLIEKFQRCGGVADFVAEIIRNAAVGVDD